MSVRDSQPRWPAGTPVAPGGRGPGGGRFRDDDGWAGVALGRMGLGPRTGKAALAAATGKLSDPPITRDEQGIERRSDVGDARLHLSRNPRWSSARRRKIEQALKFYRLWLFRPVNAHLRGSRPDSIYETPGRGRHDLTELTVLMDQALEAAPLSAPIVTYRGGDIPPLLGQENTPESLVGLQWDDPGFISTSPRLETARIFRPYEGAEVLMRLHVPAGVGAIQLQSWPNAERHWLRKNDEAELLLQRNLHFEITADQVEQHGTHSAWERDADGRERPVERPIYTRVVDVLVTRTTGD